MKPGRVVTVLSFDVNRVATTDQIVYAPQLPGVADLIHVAAAQGLTIKQIVQTASEISVSFQLANGQTRTVAYELLLAGNQMPVQTVSPAPRPSPVVVVAPSPDVCYYDPYYYYGPWYPPVSVRLGADFGGAGVESTDHGQSSLSSNLILS